MADFKYPPIYDDYSFVSKNMHYDSDFRKMEELRYREKNLEHFMNRPAPIKTITIEAALKIVNSDTQPSGQDVLDALLALKQAGWEFIINPALAHGDRNGYQITILAPVNRK